VLVHVDDMAVFAKGGLGKRTLAAIGRHFKIKDLGEIHLFLGQEVKRVKGGISLTQAAYAKSILNRFRMWEASSKATPMVPGTVLSKDSGDAVKDDDPQKSLYQEMVGALLYLSTHTRPDLAYAVGVLSRSCPSRGLRTLWRRNT
jgi:hypothetical protein